jgi:ribonuclease VapC
VIIDTSAVIAILLDEPDANTYATAMQEAPLLRMSAGTLLETTTVTDTRADPFTSEKLDEFLSMAGVVVEPVTLDQVRIGRQAYRQFGRGSGHRARLNFGDCFAYALAAETGEPLLFKGEDFTHTDLRPALPR